MRTIVVYKTKYGSTKTYADWISMELGCDCFDAKEITCNELLNYDAIIYGGGLYAEVINGVHLITKNFDKLKEKKLAVYTTGLTPVEYCEYYDKMVVEKNFKPEMLDKIRIFNFPGKMILNELSSVHKAALKTLKKIMQAKKEPSDMESILLELCDADGDFTDRSSIGELIEYIKIQ